MLIPIVCYSCGQCIASVYEEFKKLSKEHDIDYAFKKLNIQRLCCRRMLMCQHDTAELMNYNLPTNFNALELKTALNIYKEKYQGDYEKNEDTVRLYNNRVKQLLITLFSEKLKTLDVLDLASGLSPDITRFNGTNKFKNYVGIDVSIDMSGIDIIKERYTDIIKTLNSFCIINEDLVAKPNVKDILTKKPQVLYQAPDSMKTVWTNFNMITIFFAIHYFAQDSAKFETFLKSLAGLNSQVLLFTIVNYDKVRFNQDTHSLFSITEVVETTKKIAKIPVKCKEYVYNYPHGHIENSQEIAFDNDDLKQVLTSIFNGYTVSIVPFTELVKTHRKQWSTMKPKQTMDIANQQLFDLYSAIIITQ